MLGLYVHIPFCRQKCLYCDFCSFPRPDSEKMAKYVDILCNDLQTWGQKCQTETVDTVFFGGGTPTVLPPEQLSKLLHCIQENFTLIDTAEITLECNPATIDRAGLLQLRKAGFNRLSMGLQSANENELRALGRIHSFEDFKCTLSAAKNAGFERISADLMFGIPEQTPKSFRNTLERVTDLGLEHLSVYSLILESGTPLEKMKASLVFPSEETVRQMYLDAVEILHGCGLEQYEISNFARQGCESRHNLRYWNQEPYLGFGVSAYSDFHGKRFGYGRDLDAYLLGDRTPVDVEELTKHERMNEYVMLRMRLSKGLSLSAFSKKFGEDGDELFGRKLRKFLSPGLIKILDDGYAFTKEGMLVSNSILSEILDFEKE